MGKGKGQGAKAANTTDDGDNLLPMVRKAGKSEYRGAHLGKWHEAVKRAHKEVGSHRLSPLKKGSRLYERARQLFAAEE